MTDSVLAEAERILPCRSDGCVDIADEAGERRTIHGKRCPVTLRPAVAQALALRDAEIERLRRALQWCRENDLTRYDHHQKRRDGKRPSESDPPGSIWLTPTEIARAALADKTVTG